MNDFCPSCRSAARGARGVLQMPGSGMMPNSGRYTCGDNWHSSPPPTVDDENRDAEFERFLRSFYSSFANYATEEFEFVAREAFEWAWNAKNEEWQDE